MKAPRAPASPWLISVATKIAKIIGTGFLNLAAKRKARSCVLSPITANATIPVDSSSASIYFLSKIGL